MSLSDDIREQLLRSFRAELSEHVQVMTDGLLALEQQQIEGETRQVTLDGMFRAAHSLKGAARAVGTTAIEQLAHSLENVLDRLRGDALSPSPALFTACFQALDAVRLVQEAYEAGELTPPVKALTALAELEGFRQERGAPPETAQPEPPAQKESQPPKAETPAPGSAVRPGEMKAACAEIVSGLADEAPPVTPEPKPAPAELPVERPAQTTANGEQTVRVQVEKLDALMAQISELLVTRMRIEQRQGQIRQFQEFIGLWQKEWLSSRSAYGRLVRQNSINKQDGAQNAYSKDVSALLGFAGVTQEHLRQMGVWVNELEHEYTNDSLQMSMVIDKLEEEVKRVRMLPLNTITAPFGRMVRDLAQELGKEAALTIEAGETELDRQVLEQIKDPLIHLLRNAVDHGIEPPDQRAALGKPSAGSIRLWSELSGKDVVVAVSDDGAGVDMEAVRRALSRRKSASGVDVQSLSETELIDAIFQNGVSSSPIVTDISGRGVGLDVVRRNVERLNGRIEVDSRPGEGITFRLILPLRLTATRGLLVRVSGQPFVVPIHAIERILYITARDIYPLEGRDTILYQNRPVTLAPMDSVLGLPGTVDLTNREHIPAVILSSAERRVAFIVDDLLGEKEVVSKELGRHLPRVGGIAGASVEGSGEVILILNPNDLVRLALRGKTRSVLAAAPASAAEGKEKPGREGTGAPDAQAHRRVLVADDSLTTRTLEKNILEAAGYEVQVATDGAEVLSIIATEGMPNILVSDITMPRMNGFELTRRIKSDPQLAHIPVILVTSLESPEDKARGIEVGADAYIVKGRFDQNHLLDTVEQLI